MPKNTYMNRDGRYSRSSYTRRNDLYSRSPYVKRNGTYDRSRLLLTVLGVGIVVGTLAFAAVGTTSAINAMNRQSAETIAAAEAAVMEKDGTSVATTDETQVVEIENSDGAKEVFSTDNAQAEWMDKYGVTYNDDGFPIDADGNVIDNPFTSIYEPDAAAEFYGQKTEVTEDVDDTEVETSEIVDTSKLNTSETVESEEVVANTATNNSDETVKVESTPEVTETETQIVNNQETTGAESTESTFSDSWWLNDDGSVKSGLSINDDGAPYYTIQTGDQLMAIANKYGFDYMKLAEINNLDDPNMIITGDILYFGDSGSKGPGLG